MQQLDEILDKHFFLTPEKKDNFYEGFVIKTGVETVLELKRS